MFAGAGTSWPPHHVILVPRKQPVTLLAFLVQGVKRHMSKDKMPTIFLSYARGDDEPFVRRLYEDLTAHGFRVWFDRVSMPSRNLTFHQEIRDAVVAHDRLLLVIGPKAVASEYVRQEWQFAWFEAEKVVTPIL